MLSALKCYSVLSVLNNSMVVTDEERLYLCGLSDLPLSTDGSSFFPCPTLQEVFL